MSEREKRMIEELGSGYRSLVRMMDLLQELQSDVKDMKTKLQEMENRKCGCHAE